MDEHDAMLRYAGADYDKPRRVEVDEIDLTSERSIDVLIADLRAFKKRNAGREIIGRFDEGDYDSVRDARFVAYAMESDLAVRERVERTRQRMREYEEGRRAHYLQMKKEFGDDG